MLPSADRDQDQDSAALARHSTALRQNLRQYFARHGVAADELDDLVQDVFLRVARHGQLSAVNNVDAYLMRTASSVLIDRHRHRMSHAADRHVPFDVELHDHSLSPSPEDVSIARQALRQTTLLLMELPERTRTVFILNRLEMIPNREIALRLGISVSAVEKHMGRAIRHLLAHAEDVR
jgi:RNA polymerase sigma-70 factor (ECF subfamily)